MRYFLSVCPDGLERTESARTGAFIACALLVLTTAWLGCRANDPNDPLADDDTADDDMSDDDLADDDVPSVELGPGLADPETDSHERVIDPPPGVTDTDPTVATDFADSNSFLFDGDFPVQIGVDPADIDPDLMSVLRGRVLDTDGVGIEGVTVSVLKHDEFGHTVSRHDGGFDLAVHGGGNVAVRFEADGYLTLERRLDTRWNTYQWLPDVILLSYDPSVTTVDTDTPAASQRAWGSAITDDDGDRQAGLFIPAGITADVETEDSFEPLPTASMRITEYTVGDTGPESMPGDLPRTSAYTYAVELSIDEVIGTDAIGVTFSEPLIYHVENFLEFPTGIPVPTGYFDRDEGIWVPSESGLVIEIIGDDNGFAVLDVDGSGVGAEQAQLDALSITDDEQAQLIVDYGVGDSIWRVPIPHFSPWDMNMGWGPPEGARSADGCGAGPNGNRRRNCDQVVYGSVIECQNRLLGESVDIAGTDLSLNYRSNRVYGYGEGRALKIHVTTDDVPDTLESVLVEVSVAGRDWEYTFTAAPNQVFVFDEWDGYDGYNRLLQGAQPIKVSIAYIYDIEYEAVGDFGYNGNSIGSMGTITGDVAREEVSLWSGWWKTVGNLEANAAGLGGWTISPHHAYDPGDATIYYGNGDRYSLDLDSVAIIEEYAESVGTGDTVNVGPDGTVYVDTLSIAPDGTLDAESANADYRGAHVDADERFYWYSDSAIYIESGLGYDLVAGANGGGPDCSDGIDAQSSGIPGIMGIVVAEDGSIYFSDNSCHMIRRVTPDGKIVTLAGTGSQGYSGDGGVAIDASLNSPRGLDIDENGNLFFADYGNHVIRKVTVDGWIETVAGTGIEGDSGDGIPAVDADLYRPQALSVGPGGEVHFTVSMPAQPYGPHRVRRITADGTIATSAGGEYNSGNAWQVVPDIPATESPMAVRGMDVDSEGVIYLTDEASTALWRVAPSYPDIWNGYVLVPSDRGDIAYLFDSLGRHMETRNGLTGELYLTYQYDNLGQLTGIVDADANLLTIERDANGDPSAIVAPGGQRTELTLEADGFLDTVTDPMGNTYGFAYGDDGLIHYYTDPRGNSSTYLYNVYGELESAEDEAGGSTILSENDSVDGRVTTVTTAMGRETIHEIEYVENDMVRLRDTAPSGATVEQNYEETSFTTQFADGSAVTVTEAADPRWGFLTPITESVVFETPSGLTSETTFAHSVVLADDEDPLSVQWMSTTVTENGRNNTSEYDVAGLISTMESPEGRQVTVFYDALERPITVQGDASIEPVEMSYSAEGLIEHISMGTSGWDFWYDAQYRLTSVTDAAGQGNQLGYDDADRITEVESPSGRVWEYTYDANDNIESIMMPNGVVHDLDYTAFNAIETYTLPGGVESYDLEHSFDAEIESILLPSGKQIDYVYESTGDRYLGAIYDEAEVVISYDDATERPSEFSRTPAGGGTTETAIITYDGPLVTDVQTTGTVEATYSYNLDDNLWIDQFEFTADADHETVLVGYDDDGLTTSYGDFIYDRTGPNGAVETVNHATMEVVHEFDNLGRIWRRSHTVDGADFYSIELSYDLAGRIESKNESYGGTSFQYEYDYDTDGQLEEVRLDNNLIEEYGYDLNGNRDTTSSGSATFDDQDQIQTLDGVQLQFDDDGYLIQQASEFFTYSATGELLEATVNGETVNYVYDAASRLIARTDDSGTTRFYYGGSSGEFQPMASRGPDGELVTYIYGTAGNLVAFRRGDPQTSTEWYYVGTDQTGTPKRSSIAPVNSSRRCGSIAMVCLWRTATRPSICRLGLQAG